MKMKRYTLPEEHPIPVGWYPANEEEAVARIEAIEEEYERTGEATDLKKKMDLYIILLIYLTKCQRNIDNYGKCKLG